MKYLIITIFTLMNYTVVSASDTFKNINQHGKDISKPEIVFFDTTESYDPYIFQAKDIVKFSGIYNQYDTPPTTIEIDDQALQQEIKELNDTDMSSTKFTKTTIKKRLVTTEKNSINQNNFLK